MRPWHDRRVVEPDQREPSELRDPFNPPGVVWQRVSPALISARLVTLALAIVPLLIAAVVAGILVEGWAWIPLGVVLVAALWSLWLVPRQVRAYGYAEREDDLLLVHGVMFRKLTVVPYGRMQLTDVSSGPLSRRFGIADVQLHTASALTDASIPGLAADEAAELKERLTKLGEARLAGL